MKKKTSTYKSSGVDIKKTNNLVNKIENISSNNIRKEIIKNSGGFSSLFDLKKLNYNDPILLTSTDGIGTKLKLAIDMDKYENLGFDLVGMCVNDILVNGGEPLVFLDYLSSSDINKNIFLKIIKSINLACIDAGCSLVGGETAEMPGLYKKNDFDIAGFSVGAVERKNLINKNNVSENSLIFGIESNGFHSNGYSLIRKIIKDKKIDIKMKTPYRSITKILGNDFLLPTKIYVDSILPLVKKKLITSMSHITGGGIIDNLERAIPNGLQARINSEEFESHERFRWLSKVGGISSSEMLKTFNCGIGFIVIVEEKNIGRALKFLKTKKVFFHKLGVVKKTSKSKKVIINKFKPWF